MGQIVSFKLETGTDGATVAGSLRLEPRYISVREKYYQASDALNVVYDEIRRAVSKAGEKILSFKEITRALESLNITPRKYHKILGFRTLEDLLLAVPGLQPQVTSKRILAMPGVTLPIVYVPDFLAWAFDYLKFQKFQGCDLADMAKDASLQFSGGRFPVSLLMSVKFSDPLKQDPQFHVTNKTVSLLEMEVAGADISD